MLVIVLQTLTVIPSFAKTTQVEAMFMVCQEFTVKNGKKPSVGTEFDYKLTPLESGIPMPEGTNPEGEYHFKLDGTEQIAIKIKYDQVGLYQYKIEPMIEKEYSGYIYDKSVYAVNVYVKNLEEELIVTVIGTNQKNEKVGEILYENSYAAKGIGENIQTGDTTMMYQYGVVCSISLLVILFIFGGRKKEYRIYCKK